MELFKLLGTIAIDTKEADSAIDSTTKKAKKAESEQSKAFSGIGSSAKTMAVGIGTAYLAIGGAFIGAVEGTREYRTEMGKLDTAFVTSGHASESAKKTYSELHAVLGDSGQAVEASQHLAKLTKNEEELGKWTDICTGIYATFGASIPIESITESANEVSKSGVLTGGLVDALVWAGISEEEFQAKLDSCSTEQERQNLIMDTLNGTYKDASDQYKITNKDVMDAQKANENLTDAFAELGKVGEPIMTAIKNAIAKMVETAVPKIADMIEKFKEGKKWIKENEDQIKTWGAVIAGVLVTIGTFMIAMAWSSVMSKAKLAIEGVTIAVKAFNLALKSNPIGLVISIIAGLVTAIILLWNTNEDFRKFWINAWNKIKDVCQKAWEGIKSVWNKAGEWFGSIWKGIKASADDLWKNVKKFFSDAWTGIKNTWNGAQSFFNTVKTWVTTPFSSAKTSVVETFSKIYTSIKEKINLARDAVKSAIEKIKGFFNFKWSLPSLKVPSFTITGEFSLKNKTVPKIGLKWNAEGGILDAPTIFGQLADGTLLGGGEAGKEAILPLERNTEWMDILAERLNPSAEYKEIISRMNVIIDVLRQVLGIDFDIYLDSGILVGELSPAIDNELGRLAVKKNRRNI